MMDWQPYSVKDDASPACIVLDHFLIDALANKEASAAQDTKTTRNETDLRTDILYVLTDKVAYRRALPFRLVVEEVQRLQIPDLASAILTAENIKDSLRILVKQRLVREFTSADENNHYELAHDFLVRSVVRSYRGLDRRRISDLAVLKQRKEIADAEVEKLTAMSRTLSILLRGLPVITFGLTIYLCFLGLSEKLPSGLGLSYLWFLACPAFMLLLLGIAARKLSPVVLASAVLLLCGGGWMYEQSLPVVDIGTLSTGPIEKAQVCSVLTSMVDSSRIRYSQSNLKQDSFISRSELETICLAAPEAAFKELRDESGIASEYHSYSAYRVCDSIVHFLSAAPQAMTSEFGATCAQSSPGVADGVIAGFLTGFTLRPYQLNRLDSSIGVYALFLLLVHLFSYPLILLTTVDEHSILANVTRRVWAETVDVFLFWMMVLTAPLEYDYLSRSIPYGYKGALLWLYPLAIGIYVAAYVILAVKRSTTPGGLIAKLSIQEIAAASATEAPIPWRSLLGRQFFLTLWASLNIFFAIPTLVVTPLYLSLRRNHQLFYDTWCGLKLIPAVKRTAKKEKAPVAHLPEAIVPRA